MADPLRTPQAAISAAAPIAASLLIAAQSQCTTRATCGRTLAARRFRQGVGTRSGRSCDPSLPAAQKNKKLLAGRGRDQIRHFEVSCGPATSAVSPIADVFCMTAKRRHGPIANCMRRTQNKIAFHSSGRGRGLTRDPPYLSNIAYSREFEAFQFQYVSFIASRMNKECFALKPILTRDRESGLDPVASVNVDKPFPISTFQEGHHQK